MSPPFFLCLSCGLKLENSRTVTPSTEQSFFSFSWASCCGVLQIVFSCEIKVDLDWSKDCHQRSQLKLILSALITAKGQSHLLARKRFHRRFLHASGKPIWRRLSVTLVSEIFWSCRTFSVNVCSGEHFIHLILTALTIKSNIFRPLLSDDRIFWHARLVCSSPTAGQCKRTPSRACSLNFISISCWRVYE